MESVRPRSAAIFVVDVSSHMARPVLVDRGLGGSPELMTGYDFAKEYIRAQICGRIYRDLKTIPCAVLLFGYHKTKNMLTTKLQSQQGEEYDREDDLYRQCYELVAMGSPSVDMLDLLDKIGEGTPRETDIHSALVLGAETIREDPKSARQTTKEVYLITAAESPTDWDDVEKTVQHLQDKNIVVHSIVIDTQDEGWHKEQNESLDATALAVKATNIQNLGTIVDGLGPPSRFASAAQELYYSAQPVLKTVNSIKYVTTLSLGSSIDHPTLALPISVTVSKATSAATAASMKKWAVTGQQQRMFEQAISERTVDMEEDDSHERMLDKWTRWATAMSLQKTDNIDRYGSAASSSDTKYLYRKEKMDDDDDDEDAEIKEEDADAQEAKLQRPVPNPDVLSTGYLFGGKMVMQEEVPENAGVLPVQEEGFQILHFTEFKHLPWHFRLGDSYYVSATRGQLGSEKTVSSLIIAMDAAKKAAVVRFVGKGANRGGTYKTPDPRVGILYPILEFSAEGKPPLEYFIYISMPFSEDFNPDLRLLSLTNLRNKNKERIEQHSLRPTPSVQAAMDAFVDNSMLSASAVDDTVPAFDVNDSFRVAIHNMNNFKSQRAANPERPSLPDVAPALSKYLKQSEALASQSRSSMKALKDAVQVKTVPPKPKKVHKKDAGLSGESGMRQFNTLGSVAASTSRLPPPPQSPPAAKAKAEPVTPSLPIKPKVEPMSEGRVAMELDPPPASEKKPEVPPVNADQFDDPPTEDEDPPTEDEEDPPTEDEDEDVEMEGTKPIDFDAAFRKATEHVDKSFAIASFPKATACILEVRQAAISAQQMGPFNTKLEEFVDKLRAGGKKQRRFVALMVSGEQPVGLIVGASARGGVTEATAKAFVDACAAAEDDD